MNWPLVSLGEVLKPFVERVSLNPLGTYREVTVKWWGKGLAIRREMLGAETATRERVALRTGQFIISRIDARKGAAGVVPASLAGGVVTNDFPVFDVDESRLVPAYLGYYAQTAEFVELCERASEGTTNRVRLKEDQFRNTTIPLPPLEEQRRIVARVDAIASRVAEARRLQTESEGEIKRLLMAVYRRITANVPVKPMLEVAPLTRRPVKVDPLASYPQLSARSFGNGTFHQPTLHGADVTWEKPFQVRGGDILISNIKAWEGAIAVVSPEDDGRYSSHRYLIPNLVDQFRPPMQ